MEWRRKYANFFDHPQVVAAGFWGAQLFEAICDIAAFYDLEDGVVPGRYLEPAWLARRMNLQASDAPDGDAAKAISRGIDAALRAGLLAPCNAMQRDATPATLHVASTGVVISGWNSRNPNRPLTSTERSRKHREKQAHATPATDFVARNVAATDATLGEEIRRKEKMHTAGAGARSSNRDAVNPPPADDDAARHSGQGLDGEGLLGLFSRHAHPALPRPDQLDAAELRAADEAAQRHPDPAFWLGALGRIGSTPGLTGEGGNGWRWSFADLCNEKRLKKLLAGDYDGWGTPRQRADRAPKSQIPKCAKSGCTFNSTMQWTGTGLTYCEPHHDQMLAWFQAENDGREPRADQPLDVMQVRRWFSTP